MSGGAVTLQAQSHVAKYSGLDEALHCKSSGCGEGLLVDHRVDKLDLLRFVQKWYHSSYFSNSFQTKKN